MLFFLQDNTIFKKYGKKIHFLNYLIMTLEKSKRRCKTNSSVLLCCINWYVKVKLSPLKLHFIVFNLNYQLNVANLCGYQTLCGYILLKCLIY